MGKSCKVAQMMEAEVEAHALPPRWVVPSHRVALPAPNAEFAKRIAVLEAHARVGVPPWRPCITESLRYASAVPVEEAQGRLFVIEPVAA